jgi:DNA-nicking Smr family endonuclease
MRKTKAGLADLKRLSEAAALAGKKTQVGSHSLTKLPQTQASGHAPNKASTHPPTKSLQPTAGADMPTKPLNARAGAAAPSTEHPAHAIPHDKLFAQAVRAVQPLNKKQTRLLLRPAAAPTENLQLTERRQRAVGDTLTRTKPLSDGADLTQDTEVELAWAAAGIGPSVLRQLARAFWPIGARLDLHGLNSDQARDALVAFIENSQNHATRCVCIIHGVGYGSANAQPVLPLRVRQWLKQLPTVSAFAQAPKAYGGAGALLALLKLPN